MHADGSGIDGSLCNIPGKSRGHGVSGHHGDGDLANHTYGRRRHHAQQKPPLQLYQQPHDAEQHTYQLPTLATSLGIHSPASDHSSDNVMTDSELAYAMDKAQLVLNGKYIIFFVSKYA